MFDSTLDTVVFVGCLVVAYLLGAGTTHLRPGRRRQDDEPDD